MNGDIRSEIKGPLEISYVPLTGLKLNPKNPRRHTKRQIGQIVNSIKSFGFNVPILLDKENQVVAGHGRVEAARFLGLQKVPTIQLSNLTDAQKTAFAIADNKLSDNSNWNDEFLAEQLKDLSSLNLTFGLEATGFTLDEIDIRIEDHNGDIIDQYENDSAFTGSDQKKVSKNGDLWILGRHRLLCGDAINQSDIVRLMNGRPAAMCFTDPPYNVDYKQRSARDQKILNDDLGSSFDGFLSDACRNIISVTEGAIYICMSSSELHTLYSSFTNAGGYWSTFIIWAKQTFTLGYADYQRQYEPILYGWKAGNKHYWCEARNQSDVWFFDKPVRNDLHPTMKPVGLVIRALRNSSVRDDIIFDPFLGSGTSLLAAERTGRICYGLELDPHYTDVCIRRWQEHTGDVAINETTGKSFDDIQQELKVNYE